MAEVPRLESQLAFLDAGEFRDGTRIILVRAREDGVADLERGHILPDLDHFAGHVVAHNMRKAQRDHVFHRPGPQDVVDRVYARGVDCD